MPTGVYIRTKETKLKMSLFRMGKSSPAKGIKQSKESNIKRSIALKGNKNSLGRISPNKGKRFDDEWRIKLSIAHGGTGKLDDKKKVIRVSPGKQENKNIHNKDMQLQKKRFRNQRYKAKKRNAEGSHTFDEWQNLKKLYQYMCLCCKRFEPEIKLSEDHIIPLDKGGMDYITNIQPLCISCNTRKHTSSISYLPPDNALIALPN